MTIEKLDFIFPFFVLLYGLLLTLVLNWPQLMERAEARCPKELLAQLQAHRGLALICLVVGAIWSLQSLWLG